MPSASKEVVLATQRSNQFVSPPIKLVSDRCNDTGVLPCRRPLIPRKRGGGSGGRGTSDSRSDLESIFALTGYARRWPQVQIPTKRRREWASCNSFGAFKDFIDRMKTFSRFFNTCVFRKGGFG